MNYIILNKTEFFKDKIKLKNFKSVVNEKERVDAVFGEITLPVLDEIHKHPGRRNSLLPESWLLTDPGVSFILFKIDKRILHDENGKLIETLLGLYDQKNFYIEIRSYHDPQSKNQIECYIFCYNKNFGYQGDILPDKITDDKTSILEILCENIEKQLL